MTAQDSLTLQLLNWLAEKPRTYAEIMEGWRTTCPRLTIWEDACDDGLIAQSSNERFEPSAKGREIMKRSISVRPSDRR